MDIRKVLVTLITFVLIAVGTVASPLLIDQAEAQEDFTCTVVDDVLSWTDQGANRYQIRQLIGDDDSFLTSVEGATSLALPGNADSYTVRFRVGLTVNETSCAGNPSPEFTCSVDGTTLSWTDQGSNNYFVRQIIGESSSYLGSTDQLSFAVSGNADAYTVRARVNGEVVETSCPGTPLPEFTCSVDGTVLSWTDQDANNYFIRQIIGDSSSYLGSTDQLSFAVSGNADSYTVRTRVNGEVVETSCPGTPLPEFSCSVDGTTLSWTDQDANNYFVRQIIGETSSYLGSTDQLSFAVSGNADAYSVRARINGVPTDTVCPGTPLPEFTCQIFFDDGGVFLQWTDQDRDRYQIRQINDGVETYLTSVEGATELALVEIADGYVVRYRDSGVITQTSCGIPL